MFGLDGPEAHSGDSLGLLGVLAESVAAFDEARAAAEAVELIFPAEEVHDVAVCGMGGSAISADLLLGAYRERLRVPMTVVRDYYLPGWIGENTLVILSSYSGGTEETLTCASQAIERNALCVAITSGGKLGLVLRRRGRAGRPRAARLPAPGGAAPHPHADRRAARPPGGRAAPRGGPRRGAHDPGERDPHARPRRSRERESRQAARPLLVGGIPCSGAPKLHGAGRTRWKGQINENAKVPATASVLPELDHNEIVGFAGTPAELQKLSALVMLRDPRQHRQVQRRFDLTRELVEMHVDRVLSITAEGETPLARTLDLVMLGDYASLYLALLRGVDPGPVDVIERLKGRLAETGYGRAQAQ